MGRGVDVGSFGKGELKRVCDARGKLGVDVSSSPRPIVASLFWQHGFSAGRDRVMSMRSMDTCEKARCILMASGLDSGCV